MKKLYPILYTLAVIIITLCLVIPHYFPFKGPNPSESETTPPATVETLTVEEMFMKYHWENIMYQESDTMEQANMGMLAAQGYIDKLNTLRTQIIYESIINEEIERVNIILEKYKQDYELLYYDIYYIPEEYNKVDHKTFMDYTAITAVNTPHWQLQKYYAHTGPMGIRTVDGRFCIALGSHFTTTIGQYVDVILENGITIPCILGDQKSDRHTDTQHIAHRRDGSIVEFIIDSKYTPLWIRQTGYMNYCYDNWQSPVVKIKVYINQNAFNSQGLTSEYL